MGVHFQNIFGKYISNFTSSLIVCNFTAFAKLKLPSKAHLSVNLPVCKNKNFILGRQTADLRNDETPQLTILYTTSIKLSEFATDVAANTDATFDGKV